MSQSIRTEIIINATTEKVWQIITDLSSYSKWNPFIVQSSGKVAVGERVVNIMLNGGKEFRFTPRILTVRTNEYFDWLGSLFVKGIFDGRHYFEIEPVGNGQVKFIQGENFSGILCNMLLRKIGNSTRENFVQMNQALKVLAEQDA